MSSRFTDDALLLLNGLEEDENEDEEDEMLLSAVYYLKHCKKRKSRRWWVHPYLSTRRISGCFANTITELKCHENLFTGFFRMNPNQYYTVFNHVKEVITKTNTWYRESISSEERFALCIRYLATGESYRSLSYNFRISAAAISQIIPEVCEAIWEKMSFLYMPIPKNDEDWKTIAAEFEERWNFPNCLGAIDGKHIVMMAPPKSGSLYYNYKSTFSILLLAVVDASCKFIMIDVGAYGTNNDAGVFRASAFGQALARESLKLPTDSILSGAPQHGPMPYLFVGDEAFPLSKRMLRPYGGRGHNERERVFNYRLSRARRTVENAFGILASRWRVFHSKMAVHHSVCVKVVKAACVLHNFLQTTSSTVELMNTPIIEDSNALKEMVGRGHRQQSVGNEIRDIMSEYFINEGKVQWQYDKVRSGLFTTE